MSVLKSSKSFELLKLIVKDISFEFLELSIKNIPSSILNFGSFTLII